MVGVALPFIYMMSDSLSKAATSDDPNKKDGDPSVVVKILMKDFEGTIFFSISSSVLVQVN